MNEPASTSHRPLVSVITPAYNAGAFIGETIECIQKQTLEDHEHLIVDDGSKDDTLAVIQRYAAGDPRIRYHSRPNRGIYPTRNELLGMARGEFVAVVDADDLCPPDRLEKQANFLRAHPDYAAVGGRVMYIDPQGRELCECTLMRWTPEEIDAAHLDGHSGAISHGSSMLRRSAVEKVGGYRDFAPVEDLDLYLRLGEIGKIGNIDSITQYYRQHISSACHRDPNAMSDLIERVVKLARERRGVDPQRPLSAERSMVLSVARQHEKWAWWALAGGRIKTAREHAWRALRLAPMSRHSWRVMVCALRGR